MQAVEAMTRVIQIAITADDGRSIDPDNPEYQQDQLAIAVAQAMLNTALPVARWRCFVKFESGVEEGREFTLCAVNIEDIVAALVPLTKVTRKVYLTLWEQRSTGADMMQGFQGWTRKAGQHLLEDFLNLLRRYSVSSMAN